MDLKIFTDNIEGEALDQIYNLLKQEPFKSCKVRIMPDVHAGKGCVIGFTADLKDKIIPNIVGVDIGCGMLCIDLGFVDLDLERLDNIIHEFIPAGREIRNNSLVDFKKINSLYCLKALKEKDNFNKSIGTLGGGNHFIEVDQDEEGRKYLVIHTGSRNLGKQVAEYYQNLAIELHSGKEDLNQKKIELIKDYKKCGREKEIQKALNKLEEQYKNMKPKIPSELCYLEGKYREMYLHDMKICQEYASLNRENIAKQILLNYFEIKDDYQLRFYWIGKDYWYTQDMVEYPFNVFETIHNYISFEDNIVRKGAISAKLGEQVLIPMNMRDGSIIAIGKGNEDWNNSAPHGAGRIMSRGKAKDALNLQDYKESMEGIYTTSINQSTLDEAPFVYKPMQEIIDNIKDTVEIEKIIKPIYNFKSSN